MNTEYINDRVRKSTIIDHCPVWLPIDEYTPRDRVILLGWYSAIGHDFNIVRAQWWHGWSGGVPGWHYPLGPNNFPSGRLHDRLPKFWTEDALGVPKRTVENLG